MLTVTQAVSSRWAVFWTLEEEFQMRDGVHWKRRPCAAPKCSELRETANSEVNTSVSEMYNFDFMDSGPGSIPCSGMSSVDATTSSGKGDPPSVPPSGYTGSKLRETTNLKASTFACSGKSSTNVAPEASLEDTQKLPRDCLAEIIGASKTIPGTLWALVVDAAPCDVRAMTEGLLATMIQEDGTELEEAAAPCGGDVLLVRAVMTGWKYCEEDVRDVDVLVAAAVEALGEDVTDQDMLMDLIQMIQEVFDQVGFPCPPGGLELGSACRGA